MDPINANTSVPFRPANVGVPAQGETEPVEQQPAQQPVAAANNQDSISVSNPVQELQLQRSQVVEELGRSQQLQAEESNTTRGQQATVPQQNVVEFPARPAEEVSPPESAEQADQLAQEVRQQFQQNPVDSLQSQARSAERQTTLTLFQ